MKKLFLLLVFVTPAAFAQTVPPILEGQAMCYGREYSSSHMEQHPKQTVKRIEAKFFNQNAGGGVLLTLRVDLKKEEGYHENHGGKKEYYVYTRPYGNTLFCYEYEGKYTCSIDCDGGSVGFNGGFGKTLQLVNNGVTVEGGCGEEGESVWLSPEKGGDDIFNLHQLPKEFCQH